MSKKARVHIFISGLVQGVYFRQNTKRKAMDADVMGWIKNLPDGRVETVFEGDSEKIKAMIKWVGQGPKNARVQDVKINQEEHKGEFKKFKVM